MALLLGGIFALYAISTPRTVMFEDDGLFISAASSAGVAHPPGYPLFVLMGWLATHLPFGSIAWRVHTVSGLMGAVTCVCIAWLIWRRTGNRSAACLAALALAVSEHFWSQSIIADVYTTNTALLFGAVVMVQEAAAKQSTHRWIMAAVLYGLGLANHWPLMILGSPLLLICLVLGWRDFCKRLFYLVPIALLVAGSLYGWMVWRSHQSPLINFQGPIESLTALWSIINRDNYADVDSSINAGFEDKLLYLQHFGIDLLHQLSLLGAVVASGGIAIRYYNGFRFGCVCEVLAFLGSSLVLIAVLGFEYQYYFIAIFRPYPLVAYCILALWFGYGVAQLQQLRFRSYWLRMMPAVTFSLMVAGLGMWNSKSNVRTHEVLAAQRVQTILDMVEPNGVLVIGGDSYVSPLAYVHFVMGWRADVRVLEELGLLFGDRLVDPGADIKTKEKAWVQFFLTSERPVYVLAGTGPRGIGLRHLGFLQKIDHNTKSGLVLIEPNDIAKAYFKQLITMPDSTDKWVNIGRNEMIALYGQYLGFAKLIDGNEQWKEYIADGLMLAENNYWSLLGLSEILIDYGNADDIGLAETYLRKATQLATNDRSRSQEASLVYLDGVVQRKKGNITKARERFEQAIAINRRPTNPAISALKLLPAS